MIQRRGERKILEQEGTPVPGTDMLVIFPGGPIRDF
jgi:hypothetical protein